MPFLPLVLLAGAAFAAVGIGRAEFPDDQFKNMPVVSPLNQGEQSMLDALPGHKVMLDVPDEPHIFILDGALIKYSGISHYKKLVDKSLRRSGTVVLKGERDVLLELKPDWLNVWPDSNTIILTSRMGARVDGVRDRDASDFRHIVKIIEKQVKSAREAEASLLVMKNNKGRYRRSTDSVEVGRKVAFSLRPGSPVETCTDFGNNLIDGTFGRPLKKEEQQALSIELSRWCQSGTLSNYQAAIGSSAVPRWLYTEQPKLSLLTEWALIRSEDTLVPSNSKYLLWVKTVGQGAGAGFTRSLHDTATFKNNVMYGLLDATIHAGWGNIFPDKANSWAYPTGRDNWASSDPALFGCNFGDRGSICPSSASVVRLFPSDTFNNQINIAQSTSLSIGGTFGVKGLSSDAGSEGGPVKGINATFNISSADAITKSSTISLTNVQTSSALKFSRSTRWRPDVPAIWDYLVSRSIVGNFGEATPTAATINPEYDVLWQIPAKPNRGKVMKFSIIYEAGWNNCVREICAVMETPPDKTIPPQKRVFWSDSVLVDFRVRSENDVIP